MTDSDTSGNERRVGSLHINSESQWRDIRLAVSALESAGLETDIEEDGSYLIVKAPRSLHTEPQP